MQLIIASIVGINSFALIAFVGLSVVVGFFLGICFGNWNRKCRIKRQADDARARYKTARAERATHPMPDLIWRAVCDWLYADNPSWADTISYAEIDDSICTISIAQPGESKSEKDWLAGFWYCNIDMELTDEICLLDLGSYFESAGSITGMYTNSESKVIQIYFRKATPEEFESFTAANQAA